MGLNTVIITIMTTRKGFHVRIKGNHTKMVKEGPVMMRCVIIVIARMGGLVHVQRNVKNFQGFHVRIKGNPTIMVKEGPVMMRCVIMINARMGRFVDVQRWDVKN